MLGGCAGLEKSDPVTVKDQAVNLTSYVACGCGCCPGEQPIEECLFHSKVDDINRYIRRDRAMQQKSVCKTSGCTRGIKYLYCD